MSSQRWRDLLNEEPDNELVRFSLAKALIEEKRFGDALEHLSEIIKVQPDFALAFGMLGRCYLAVGKKDQARQMAEQGLALSLEQKHEVPEMEARAVLEELDSEF